MNLFSDLKSSNAMYGKAVLFLVGAVGSAAGLFVRSPDLRTAFLLAVLVWSSCRLYYFLFYVIERYIDPSFRFDGLFSAIRYLVANNKQKRGGSDPQAP
ncbi:MAG: hypothetical protein H7145_10870 [Akkermansiaceae bacterium]|nr:hypothetical protein [Armatimonadota bacterium]